MDSFNPDEFLAEAGAVEPIEQLQPTPVAFSTPTMPNVTPVEGHPATETSFDPDSFLAEAHKAKYETPEQMGKTFAEGVGEGALGPVFTLAQRAANVNPEDIKGRQETNPMTYGAGQVTGLGASLLTGVGEGAIASKAGLAAKEAAGLAKAEGVLGKMAAEGIDQATQLALMQGSDEISKMINSDPETSSQNAIANVGLAAALGGATGMAIGSISPLWKASKEALNLGKDVKQFANEVKILTEAGDPVAVAKQELTGVLDNLDILRKEMGSNAGFKAEQLAEKMPEMTPKNTEVIKSH